MEALSKLGINPWSILLYLINLGSVLLVMTYLLYKPILGFIDKRRKEISDSIEEAKILRDEFDNTLAKSEKEKKAIEAKFRDEMSNLKKYIEEKRSELVKEMEVARTEMMAKAQSEIDEKKAVIMKEAEAATMALIKKVILEIVQNKVPENVIQDSIKEAWHHYKIKNV